MNALPVWNEDFTVRHTEVSREGNLRIDCYDENALSVRCGKNILLIAGRGLRVTLLDGEALAVSGTITSIAIDA